MSQSVINKCTDPGMNNLESLVALIGTCGGVVAESIAIRSLAPRLLSRSTAKGPSHQKLMSYLDHAVSSALFCENTAGPERKEPPRVCACVCFMCLMCLL